MKVDSVVTLDNKNKYLILDKATIDLNNYYLAVLLDDEEKATDNSVILKETNENNEIFLNEETDEEIIKKLLEIFTKSFNRYMANLD